MNRDQIIALAREAGFAEGVVETVGIEGFANFAALVAAAEREACAALCDDLERKKWQTLTQGGKLSGFGAVDCAAGIRSRA